VLSKEEAPQPTSEDAFACLVTMQRHERENAVGAIRDSIKTAEREGRMQEALDLMQKLRSMTDSRADLR